VRRVLRGVRKEFNKVLDDAAKADQNLASLLLTTDCESDGLKAVKKAKSLSIAKRNFQKYLTTAQKAD
ncbi:hypothetical protein, partial [Roseateles sp. LYH14W]